MSDITNIMGMGGFGFWYIKTNSHIRDALFSATQCLLLEHMASLASNSSDIDSKIAQRMFPRHSGQV